MQDLGRHGFEIIGPGDRFDQRLAFSVHKVDLAKGPLFLLVELIQFERAGEKLRMIPG